MAKSPESTFQMWGNSLAVRIPAAVARSARIRAGQPVEIVLTDDGLRLRPKGESRTTLAEKLAAYEPEFHGGEAMQTTRIGREAM